MKYILFFILGLLSCIASLQAQSSVSGNVKDKTNSSIQGCTVLFMQADSLIGGTITDKGGDFKLKELPNGNYVCRITMIGFKQITHPFSLSQNARLPQFILEEDATQLSEVVVTGDKRDRVRSGAGSTTFFLSEQAKKATNTYQALVEIPTLVVNTVERKISLTTGETPLILIDGIKRPNYMDLLNPELIESIEIIDNPSARYTGDEAVTSILNIHLKRVPTPTYFNGNFYTQHAVTSRHGVSYAGFETGNTTSSLYVDAQHFYFTNDKSDYSSAVQTGDLLKKLSGKRKYNSNSYYASIGGDHLFSDKNYAAFSVKYISNPTDSESDSKGSMEYVSDQRYTDASSYQQTDNQYHQTAAYLYYKHTFNKQQRLEATGNYAYTSSTSSGDQFEHNDFYQYNHLIDFSNSRHYGKLDLDYTNLIKDDYSLTAGSNSSYSTTHIDDLNDRFPVYNYQRWQEYLYVGFDNNRSDAKFNYTFSLGVDMLFSKADDVENHYIDLLPAIAFAYKFTPKQTLSLSYKRVRFSPSTGMLNPRNTSTDSLYISEGNPFLTPSFQDKVRLSYKLNYKKLYLEPYVSYTYSSDLISAIGTVDGNIYTSTYKNFLCANFLSIGTTINYNFPFGNINLTSGYEKRYQKEMPFSGDKWSVNLSGYFYYKNLSLMVSGGYQTASYDRTLKRESAPWSNATLAWKLPKGWQVSLMGQSFLCSKMRSKTWVVDNDYRSFKSSIMTDRFPMLLCNVSYSFKSKTKSKARDKKKFYNMDSGLEGVGVK